MKFYDKRYAKRKKPVNRRALLIAAASVLAIAAAVIIALVAESQRCARIIDFGTVIKGVSVNGVDISGMTERQALDATSHIEAQMLGQVNFKLDVDGEILEFGAQDIGVVTDYSDIIDMAVSYGRTGTFGERQQAAESEGASFTVSLTADRNLVSEKLKALKKATDKAPKDAEAHFMPWGYTSDGTEYKPELEEIKAMADKFARGKEYERPELSRIAESDLPLAIRYEYYNSKDELEKGLRPASSDISRFQYTPEVKGISADTSAVLGEIMEQVSSGEFAVITVPVSFTEAKVKLKDAKKQTALIASWTSSYAKHYNYNRNYNVAMMSSLINGSVMLPGQEWSANDTAGKRNAQTAKVYGWTKAPGLENGGTTDQYGGGVCQLGSTVYNSAIRSGLEVVKKKHHSIPSDYIPLGLDATLSTGGPDLVLKNNSAYPYYMVSYLNPKEKNVTVEIYGPPLTDPDHPEWGNVIYSYTSEFLGYYGTPGEKTTYNTTVTLDGKVLSPENPVYVFAEPKKGRKARVFRHVYSPDGNTLCEPVEYENHSYPVIDKVTYIFWPETGPPPTPVPSPTEPPASATPEPTEPPEVSE